jgi:methylphosphotriester-DNA--protein-cysteine methyltransferase
MQPHNRRPFRSLADARAAGYRPCKVCRPVAVADAA